MMNLKLTAELLASKLSSFDPVIKECSSGSFYVSIKSANVNIIRVANHTGHKSKRSTWQLRCDVSSSNKYGIRIFNCVNRLVSQVEFKLHNQ